MHKIILFALATSIAAPASVAFALETAAKSPMTFFVTSSGSGHGGNLGGVEGADKICQARAESVGAGNKTWRAYLSTQGPGAVKARDRIGRGPWHNAKGDQVAADLADLHGDTLELARKGNLISRRTSLTEKGETISGGESGENLGPSRHDILTGTRLDGTAYTDGDDHTCRNWTSETEGSAQVGHHNRSSASSISWNSAHPTPGCSQEKLKSVGGDGLLYCFAR